MSNLNIRLKASNEIEAYTSTLALSLYPSIYPLVAYLSLSIKKGGKYIYAREK